MTIATTDKDRAAYAALQAASAGNLPLLRDTLAHHARELGDVYRSLLLYLPEHVDAVEVVKLADDLPELQDADAELENLTEADDFEIHHTLRNVELKPLTLDEFLTLRSRNVLRITGSIEDVVRMFDAAQRADRAWLEGIVLPLQRLALVGIDCSVERLEKIDADGLLQLTFDQDAEDVDVLIAEVLVPVAAYRRDLQVFDRVQAFLIGNHERLSLVQQVVTHVVQTELAAEVKRGVVAVALAACYLYRDAAEETTVMRQIQIVLARTADTFTTKTYSAEDAIPIANVTASIDGLLDPSAVTFPSKDHIDLFGQLVEAARVIGPGLSLQTIYNLRLADELVQRNHLRKSLLDASTVTDILALRDALLPGQLLPNLDRSQLESSILRSLLARGHVDQARKLYVATSPRPLPAALVEEAVLEAFHDVITDTQTSITDLQSAADLLAVIHPKHATEKVKRLQLLVDTLRELASYRGASALRPATFLECTSASAVLELFARVLQERGGYRKHFRLLGLYQNCCLALGLDADADAFHETVVNAALSYDNLPFALELIDEAETRDEAAMDVDSTAGTPPARAAGSGSSWRLIYQVCKYPSESPAVDAKKVELLSNAVATCPADQVARLLALHAQLDRSARDRALGDRRPAMLRKETSDVSVLGGNSSSAGGGGEGMGADAPKSLLDAARAATRAARQYLPDASAADAGAAHRREGADATAAGRVRRRDQLAAAVESRFTSGIGWLIGAGGNPQ